MALAAPFFLRAVDCVVPVAVPVPVPPAPTAAAEVVDADAPPEGAGVPTSVSSRASLFLRVSLLTLFAGLDDADLLGAAAVLGEGSAVEGNCGAGVVSAPGSILDEKGAGDGDVVADESGGWREVGWCGKVGFIVVVVVKCTVRVGYSFSYSLLRG